MGFGYFRENKITIYVLVVIALVFAGWYFYGERDDEFKLITNDEELAEFMQDMKEGDLEEYLAKKDELYAQDTYGGDTPEETLGLFIEALKMGDAELASKYFVLEKQEEKFKSFKIGKENGIFELLIGDLERAEKGGYSSSNYDDFDDKYQFVVIGNEGKWDGVVEFTFDLVLNKQTGKWKMESL